MIAYRETSEGRGERVRKLDQTLQSAVFFDQIAYTHRKRSSFSVGLPRAKT